MNKGLTKIVNKRCQDCGKQLSILCNENCQIVAARCPECLQILLIRTVRIEDIKTYLEDRNWEVKENGVFAPDPQVYIFIPSNEKISDYILIIKNILNTLAQYYDKTIDEILLEMLGKDNF